MLNFDLCCCCYHVIQYQVQAGFWLTSVWASATELSVYLSDDSAQAALHRETGTTCKNTTIRI